MTITRETVFQAADTLLDQGQEPTLAAVRAALGGGSYTTISEAMKVWRAERDALTQARAIPPPQAAQDRAAQLVGEVWQLAQAAAEARLESERQALATVRAELEAQAREAAELADQMETQLEQVNARLEALIQERDAARHEAKGALVQAARLEGQLQAEQDRRQHAETEATHLRAQFAAAEAQVTAMTEALAKAERQTERAEARAAEVQAHVGRLAALLERLPQEEQPVTPPGTRP